ncbi:MAG: sigma-54 dependent transcriptional regulator [Hyphomonas sp.]
MSQYNTIILLTSDEQLTKAAHSVLVAENDCRLITFENEREAQSAMSDVECDLLICDDDSLEDSSDNILTRLRVRAPATARILITDGEISAEAVDLASRAATFMYLVKPVQAQQLKIVVKRALEISELSRRHRLLSRELKLSIDDHIFKPTKSEDIKSPWSRFEKLIYVSPKMDELCALARQAAATEIPILIQGETGTGKELMARAVHYNSDRKNSPMHVQNCGGFPDDVLHSELFGHVAGAYSGALTPRLGLFRAADGGTVFLDEISEVSPVFQVSLLRFLQEGEVKPLGSDETLYSNVRVIAASNRPLEELVVKGTFRRDLYYRLKGIELNIPPLRQRLEDVPALSTHFLERASEVSGRHLLGIAMDALKRLSLHNYPGNVRELQMEIQRAVTIAGTDSYILTRHLSPNIASINIDKSTTEDFEVDGATLKEMVEKLEKHVVSKALERHRWNQKRAAEQLGVSRVGIANKIKRYELSQG